MNGLFEIISPQTVSRAAAFLDQEYPTWEEYINLDTLDMNDARRCIAGQLGSARVINSGRDASLSYGGVVDELSYLPGFRDVTLDEISALMAFDPEPGLPVEAALAAYDELDRLWRIEIASRLR